MARLYVHLNISGLILLFKCFKTVDYSANVTTALLLLRYRSTGQIEAFLHLLSHTGAHWGNSYPSITCTWKLDSM